MTLEPTNRPGRGAASPGSRTMDQVIRAVAARTPDAMAVASPTRQLSYGEVEWAASLLAAAIARTTGGVDREPVVAIALDRSALFVPGVLACWIAGAAYLPIDPGLPRARVEFMLRDTEAPVVLTDAASAELLGPIAPPVLLAEEVLHAGGDPLATSTARSEGLAYVIYTSGSTGTPKGVAVEHGQLVHYVEAVTAALQLPRATRWAAVSSFTTDLAHTALYVPLATGGSVHTVPKDLAVDPIGLEEYIRSARIECLKITPTHLAALLGGARPLPRLRLVFGGEVLPWTLVDRVHEAAATCAIYNHYGPTETTVGTCTYRCQAADPNHEGAAPIGHPLGHSETLVLDDEGRSVLGGEIGELYVAGAGVARGYLNRPAATAEQFLPNPRGGPSARMFRTGDLVRMLPDGALLFLGRRDDQVKVRGYRVEPGEVEAALARHPGVRQAAVVTRRDNLAGAVLVAYVVAGDSGVSTTDLRAFLAARLPDPMVPSEFVAVPRFPLLPSGKVDRSALSQTA
jgi:amino acid adenylation domain-containing protein